MLSVRGHYCPKWLIGVSDGAYRFFLLRNGFMPGETRGYRSLGPARPVSLGLALVVGRASTRSLTVHNTYTWLHAGGFIDVLSFKMKLLLIIG